MNIDTSNHRPIDRDAQRLSQELDAVRARLDRPATSPRPRGDALLLRWRTAVAAIRDVFDGIAYASARMDRINRPWIYQGPAWVDGAHGAVRISLQANVEAGAGRPQSAAHQGSIRALDASRTGLRHAH